MPLPTWLAPAASPSIYHGNYPTPSATGRQAASAGKGAAENLGKPVILSAAKNLRNPAEVLRCVQNEEFATSAGDGNEHRGARFARNPLKTSSTSATMW
jgi:hypothetical protein